MTSAQLPPERNQPRVSPDPRQPATPSWEAAEPRAEPAAESTRVTEATRDAAIDRIQQAMVDDIVAFEELDERFAQVYRSETSADLELAMQGIPEQSSLHAPVPSHHPARRRSVALIGDAKVGGWISVGEQVQAICVIGDATIDLSTAEIPPEGTTIEAYSAIGDVRVIVPDGARVETQAFTLIGGRSELLTRPVQGGPRITVRIFSLIGDTQIYSLSQVPDGWLRRLWKSLRGASE